MSSNFGTNIELSIFGESHGEAIGVVLGNLPSGIKLDMDEINRHMKRRAPGNNKMSTSRKEADEVHIVSGMLDGYTTGAPLCALIYNSNQHSKDYSELKIKMRPGHSDYPASVKYNGFNDVRGGGHFSGRITAPIVFAGSVCRQILAKKGIDIGSHIKSIKNVQDASFDTDVNPYLLALLTKKVLPTIDPVDKEMEQVIMEAVMKKNSVGGKIECAITGLPAGIGNPFFDSVESHLSPLLFSIPAVKSVSFGFEGISELYGSEANDEYYYDGDVVKTKTNNNGGITGGITNGMPVVFTVGIKPTPSIALKQNTVNLKTKENDELQIVGRHDPCIVQRAVVVVESMAAIGLLDLMGAK